MYLIAELFRKAHILFRFKVLRQSYCLILCKTKVLEDLDSTPTAPVPRKSKEKDETKLLEKSVSDQVEESSSS